MPASGPLTDNYTQSPGSEEKSIANAFERPPRDVFLTREAPNPRIRRNHTYGCKQQEVYSNTQVPGATRSLGRLARLQVGVRGSYRRAKARVQKRKAWLRGFIPLVNSNKAKSALSGKFLTFHLNTKEGVVQGLPAFLAGDPMADGWL